MEWFYFFAVNWFCISLGSGIFTEPKIGLLPNKYNFRYYGTKNAELASKERTNSRSAKDNTGEPTSNVARTNGKDVARESQSFSSASNTGNRRIDIRGVEVTPKAIHTVKKAYPESTIDKELFEVDANIFHKAATKAK